MGEHEEWAEPPSGLLPNGLLPNEATTVMQVLDSERWLKAEERTAELIACIQPTTPSEERRNAVADYVQRLIKKCFPCQVFTFGSVPLKTYLPDGDIDLTAFSKNQNLKDTWAHEVRDMLENEEKNDSAEFRVKEVQYIQAEVKIIKCLVENIVVDISFDQLGGLCTLCFLEEVDHLINENHLFKRSIILIKAWCYYESRILGAHHGLISTYALETLVLYIFHVFNNSFAGPLEVLYRFLEFFSKFDWENFCVSLWGPVPISSFPDVTAEPPRRDGGELLLSKLFLEACSSVYAVFPGGQENQGQPFVSKHFNVIDPLRVNNNLGRSVSKGNFFRIRSAFGFGAKRLARLLECPKEEICFEVNQFFTNTWERHGSGHRPDAPKNDLLSLRLSNPSIHGSDNTKSDSPTSTSEISSTRESQSDRIPSSHIVTFQHGNSSLESTLTNKDVSTVSRTQVQKNSGNPTNSRISDQSRKEIISNQSANNDKGQRSSKPENLVNDIHGRFLFARTRSSPELTDTYRDVSSQVRRNRPTESGKGHNSSSVRIDTNRRKNLESDVLSNHSMKSADDHPADVRHISSSRQSLDASVDANSCSISYHNDSGSSSVVGDEFVSVVGAQGMQQEEQDLVNLMASSASHGFNGPVHVPLNLASGHLPLPIPSSVLGSMGYGQRNLSGMIPTNIPLIETPWGMSMHFPQGLVPSPLTHYFPGMGSASNSEDAIELGKENFSSVETNSGEVDNEFWHEQDRSSATGFDIENNVGFEMHQPDDKHQSTSGAYDFVPSSRSSSRKVQQKFTKENRVAMRDDHVDAFQYQDGRGNDIYYDDRTASSRPLPTTHTTSSLRNKTSPESSWEGSSAKVSKSTREKWGWKTSPSFVSSSSVNGKDKNVTTEHLSIQIDDENRDWSVQPTMGTETAERCTGAQSVASLHVPRHQMPGYEPAQTTSESDPSIPLAPVLLGPSSHQRGAIDNSGVLPFTFYPTGPPVPFVAMLPVYNFPTDTGTSETSTSHFSREQQVLDNSDSGRNFDSSEGHEQPMVLSASNSIRSADSSSELKPDILNSDFASHWHNLQYGRFCQNSRYPAPLIYPSNVVVPPAYLQGRVPWDGPGRPVSANMNLLTLDYGSRLVPVAPLPSVSNRPTSLYQPYVDEIPRYRSGTGTYLPNPKVSPRDRHSASSRRGNYNYDRNDYHGDREGNWNTNSKTRTSGRNHGRSQAEKLNSRLDRLSASESRSERPWGSHRHGSFSSYQSQNGPIRSNSAQSGSNNVAYGMYPLQGMNPSGVSSNGPTMPSVVMLYPYDHNNTGYGSAAEKLEFGSLGPVGFSGVNEVSQLNEANRMRGGFDDQRFHGGSAQRSSPDQPSSPHFQRGI